MMLVIAAVVRGQEGVDFARDVQPILSDNCYRCHGPDAGARKAGLRLDTREGAIADLGGRAAIVPGLTARSRLLERVAAADPGDRMPPSHTGKRLTKAQIATLETWIAQGAPWGRHWAFVPPKAVAVPPGAPPNHHIVGARLEAPIVAC